MKRVLAAVAVLAVNCMAITAFAAHEIVDVDKPSPTGALQVYGAAKLSVDMIDTGSKVVGADTDLFKASSNSSRLGFKGAEDLGNGLSTVYQLELGINMDGSTSTVATGVTNTTTGAVSTTSVNTLSLRNTYLGLKGGFGTVLFGTHDTPYKTATGQFDAFGDSMGDYNAIIGNVNGSTIFDLRPIDLIAYTSPSLGGVQVSVAAVLTGTESSNGINSNASAYSAAAVYKSGPLALALAHEIHKNGTTTLLSDSVATTVAGTKLGAGYAFGGTKLGLVFETLESDLANSTNTRDAVYIAVSQKLGSETIKLAYGNADDGESTAKTGATFMAVGLDHAFSKRTTAYVLYAATDNDAGATYGLGQSGAGGAYKPAADEDPSVISFGVNYSF